MEEEVQLFLIQYFGGYRTSIETILLVVFIPDKATATRDVTPYTIFVE
jgi:hypothetical protein